jgi:hypothetical protein
MQIKKLDRYITIFWSEQKRQAPKFFDVSAANKKMNELNYSI